MSIKSFFIRKMLERQLRKAGLPQEQQDMLIEAVVNNPEFFETLAKEAKQMEKDRGIDQMSAMTIVMQKHQGELQKLFKK